MRYKPQEILAGTTVPSPPFDCELPPDVRQEMLKPKRPAILRRPVYQPPARSGVLKWAGAFALVAIILVGSIGHYSQGLKQPGTPQSVAPVIQPTPALEKPASQPLAKPQPILEPPAPPPPAVSAPRARLVRLPSPPLRLNELTPEHIDESHRITMPYGTEVLATLRGFLENENQLPQIGRIGDMYVVENVPWIWIRVPGTTSPTWVDP